MSETRISPGEASDKIASADWERLKELADRLAAVTDEAWRLWLRLPESLDSVDSEGIATTMHEVAAQLNELAENIESE
jgi:hypothetical protein